MHPFTIQGVIIINITIDDITIDLNVTKENTMAMQELVLKLVITGVVSQENAREFFIKAERLRGIEIK